MSTKGPATPWPSPRDHPNLLISQDLREWRGGSFASSRFLARRGAPDQATRETRSDMRKLVAILILSLCQPPALAVDQPGANVGSLLAALRSSDPATRASAAVQPRKPKAE